MTRRLTLASLLVCVSTAALLLHTMRQQAHLEQTRADLSQCLTWIANHVLV